MVYNVRGFICSLPINSSIILAVLQNFKSQQYRLSSVKNRSCGGKGLAAPSMIGSSFHRLSFFIKSLRTWYFVMGKSYCKILSWIFSIASVFCYNFYVSFRQLSSSIVRQASWLARAVKKHVRMRAWKHFSLIILKFKNCRTHCEKLFVESRFGQQKIAYTSKPKTIPNSTLS